MLLPAFLAMAIPIAAVRAQAAPQAPATGVELDHEAHHHLVLSNDFVRVYNVIVAPGDSTLYHHHPDDYAFVTFGGAKLKSQKLGDAKADLILGDGEVRFTKAPITHRVLNPSTSTFHNLSIDVMKAKMAFRSRRRRAAKSCWTTTSCASCASLSSLGSRV